MYKNPLTPLVIIKNTSYWLEKLKEGGERHLHHRVTTYKAPPPLKPRGEWGLEPEFSCEYT